MARLILLIAGDPPDAVRAAHGDYAAIIRAASGWQGEHASHDLRIELPRVEPGDALVISGSTANVPTREPWIVRAETWLAGHLAAGTPALGLCFGHQLIAQALGGEVAQNPRGREMGTQPIERVVADDPLLDGLPARFLANQSHKDTVARLPAGASVLAKNAHDDHQAVRFAERCYGVQFHPEFDGAIIREFIAARREVLTTEGIDADALQAADTPDARRILGNFLGMLG
jgi:GMP synthase (glutamine-hydrolysing)